MKEVVALIFSKNRAFQLKALLDSFSLYCGSYSVDFTVLYKAEGIHLKQYQKLAGIYKDVCFVEEGQDLIFQVIVLLEKYSYVLFLTDDTVFYRKFSFEDAFSVFRKVFGALGFSFRLGQNIRYSYMARKGCKEPIFYLISSCSFGVPIFSFDWTKSDSEFNYPFDLSGALYRTSVILPMVKGIKERTVNGIESGLFRLRKNLGESFSLLLCFKQSVAVSIPVNVVQTCRPFNRFGEVNPCSAETLAGKFDQGYNFDVSLLKGLEVDAPHVELNLENFLIKV